MERCDRCGARAANKYALPSGRDLFFCGHHSREHGDRIVSDGAVRTPLVEDAAAHA